LERLLEGGCVPGLLEGDVLALFPVAWVNEVNNKRFPDKPLLIEQTGGAHFELVGEIDHRFAKYLSDNSVILTQEQWRTAQHPLKNTDP
jgi:hypothetical protein